MLLQLRTNASLFLQSQGHSLCDKCYNKAQPGPPLHFWYNPIRPILQKLLQNERFAEQLLYPFLRSSKVSDLSHIYLSCSRTSFYSRMQSQRHCYVYQKNQYTDIMDGAAWERLSPADSKGRHRPNHIMLLLSFDGVAIRSLFKKKSYWPIGTFS